MSHAVFYEKQEETKKGFHLLVYRDAIAVVHLIFSNNIGLIFIMITVLSPFNSPVEKAVSCFGMSNTVSE